MSKELERNEDWVKRENGRIPSKGAMAAERASAGLGTSGEDGSLIRELAPPATVWAARATKRPRPEKQ